MPGHIGVANASVYAYDWSVERDGELPPLKGGEEDEGYSSDDEATKRIASVLGQVEYIPFLK